MLTYLEVHYYFTIPPIIILALLYAPLFGRRDAVKIGWLMLMATLYTTPWDNFIIAHQAWSYPPSSVWFKIFNVPFEEHLFFILQPILVVLLHSIATLPHMLPFGIPKITAQPFHLETADEPVQTLRRKPLAALAWFFLTAIGFGLLFSREDGRLDLVEGQYFYLGCIFAWICPVIGILTLMGGSAFATRGDLVTWIISTLWLWTVDSIAIRDGSWHIAESTSTNVFVWDGLPIEEAIFFALTNYLLVLSCSLISHLHVLLVLAPALSPSSRCPPGSFGRHVSLLCRLILQPPPTSRGLLIALADGEETLRKGSRSFSWAKLWWTREIRCGLVATYGWCRITDDLIDNAKDSAESQEMLAVMEDFLDEAYLPKPATNSKSSEVIFSRIPIHAQPAFYLFERMLPALIPRRAFDDLLSGYRMDLRFSAAGRDSAIPDSVSSEKKVTKYVSPIQNQQDLLQYADYVAGSVADMICHLAWRLLENEEDKNETQRVAILQRARHMGQALQLVNIARDVRTDAAVNRVYIPMETFTKRPQDLEDLLRPPTRAHLDGSYRKYTEPLLETAYALRGGSTQDIDRLPREARAGTRAMVASYFEIGEEIRRQKGELGPSRLRVSKRRRLAAILGSWSVY